jgi:anaerobic selenocysteine-containing dehydrogenase
MEKIDRREFVKYVSTTAAGFSLLGTKAFAEKDKLTVMKGTKTMKSKCATCWLRRHAERNPNSLRARLWQWHTTWCPGWKAYQKELPEKGVAQAS